MVFQATIDRPAEVSGIGLHTAVKCRLRLVPAPADTGIVFRRVDLETARQLAEEHDRWRQLYLRNYYDLDWDDPLLYHATINTGRLEIEDAADLVVRYVVQQS